MFQPNRTVIAFGIEAELPLRGGVNVLLETLIEGVPLEWEVVLLSTDPPGSDPPSLHPRVTRHIHWSVGATSKRQAQRVAAECQDAGVRLVHFHGGVFGFGMRLPGHCPISNLRKMGIRSIWTNHTWTPLLTGYLGSQRPVAVRLAAFPFAWLSRVRQLIAVDQLVVSSRYALGKERLYYWPARNKTRLIYYTRSSPEPGYSHTRKKTIASVGHIAERKGQLTLMRAFERIAPEFPEWRLQIIGPPVEADYMKKIEEIARTPHLSARVEMPGGIRDAHRFTAEAGIFVQPSLFEGLPVALMEAFSCSAPCVATACQGNDELVVDRVNSLVFPKSDVAALAGALAELIGKPALREKLGNAARDYVITHQMTREAMVESHLKLYRWLLGNERSK